MNPFSKLMNRFRTRFYPLYYSDGFIPVGGMRDNDLIGSIADVIAKNTAKLQPKVIRKDAKGMTVKNDSLSRLLTTRPCPEMSTYDFLYRLASDLVYTSNAFAVLFYDDNFLTITSIQPVTVRSFDIVEDSSGRVFLRFVWEYDGKEYTVPYESVIHIKARYNKRRFTGTPPDGDLQEMLELVETTNHSIKNIVRNGSGLRGYLKYGNFIDDEEMKKKVKDFQDAYMSADNDGGLAGLDNSMDFKEFTQRAIAIPTAQMQFLRDNVYRYYGVNEKVLTSSQTPEEWNAFYESVIEPIAIQLSLEFTYKVFTERERGFGNRVIFTADRLQYATLDTRKALAGEMYDRGVITINEYRELLYLPPIEEGDVRMVSLNYVKADDQSTYQVGKDNGESEGQAQMRMLVKTRLKGGESDG